MLIKFLLFGWMLFSFFVLLAATVNSAARPNLVNNFSFLDAAVCKYYELSVNGPSDGDVTTCFIQTNYVERTHRNLLTNYVAFCFDYYEQWHTNNLTLRARDSFFCTNSRMKCASEH